ncbi:hornerin-like [Iris pallida]|uniref:Hornerin-like n=2 Tax=Iris pallida TaxID=29817 RepID=A0AAX6IBE8_IRIPA|nr:hornerin-like [Iris pallida]
MNWLILDSRTFRELFLWCWNFGGYFCGPFWLEMGFPWFGTFCRCLLARFPVLGLSRNRGSAAQFLQNYIFN